MKTVKYNDKNTPQGAQDSYGPELVEYTSATLRAGFVACAHIRVKKPLIERKELGFDAVWTAVPGVDTYVVVLVSTPASKLTGRGLPDTLGLGPVRRKSVFEARSST